VNRYLPLLRDPGYRAIWAASLVSGLGDRIATIALYLLIFRQTGSPVDLGLLAATQIVPAILLGPVTGLVCDRKSRKSIMIASDLASALVAAAIPLVRTTGQVYVLATALGCCRQFNGPARLALLPDVVSGRQLGTANGMLMLTRNLVLLIGPAMGGALVAWQGTDWAFWFNAATFVTSASILAAWRFDEPMTTTRPASAPGVDDTLRTRARRVWTDLADGVAGVLGHAGLRLAFGFFAVLTFVTAMQQPLVVVFVKDVLQGSDVQLGVIISAAGLGGILGALGGGAAVSRNRPLRLIGLLIALDGILLVVFSLNRSFTAALLIFACFGALATLVQIALATYLQEATPEERRGRTFGWLGTVIGPLSLASVFLGPLAAALIGVVAVLVLCGLAELVIGTMGLLSRDRASGPQPETP
jgi:MFS family permease